MTVLKKILIITDIPNPYRIPLFNTLDSSMKAEGFEMKVVFGSAGQANRAFEIDMNNCSFSYEVLHSKRLEMGYPENTIINYKGLKKILNQEKPDKIIVIGFTVATMKLWWRSLFRKTHYLIWSGSIRRQGINTSLIRRIQRKMLIKRASGFIVYGTKSKEYFMGMGVPESRITIAVNTTDTAFFKERTNELRASIQKKVQLKHLTYVGYLTPRKNVKQLLEVATALLKKRSDFILDIIGDGVLREELELYVKEHKLSDHVTFHGFKQKEELPQFLAGSDVFLFQTDFDIWGLVLVEAMAAGLPCIASVNAGATQDLIQEGVTGFALNFSETGKAAERIDWLLNNPDKANTIGMAAQQFIHENINIEKSVEGFMKAIKKA